MANNTGTAAADTVLMLQTFNKKIDLLENVDDCLDKRFTDMGEQTKTSLQDFRIPLQYSKGGNFSALNTDGGAYPLGNGAGYNQGTMTPFEVAVSFTATDQERRIGSSGKDVILENPVDRMIAQAVSRLSEKRNKLLQGFNTGRLATVSATYAGGGLNPVPLAAAPFGARLIDINDNVQVMSGDGNYVLRGSGNANDVQKNGIGTGNTITFDNVPAGTVAGDYIMVDGVAAGTPQFYNGLEYIVSPSPNGEYLGMSRALSYTQSPAYNANTSLLTLGVVDTFFTRMMQTLGVKSFRQNRNKNFWYGHPAQWDSWKQLGYASQMVTMPTGKAPAYDGVENPQNMPQIGGHVWELDTIAAIDKLYFLDQSKLVRCRFNKAPEFVEGMIDGIWFQRPGTGGQWLSIKDAFMYDAVNYATMNNWAQGVIYNLSIGQPLDN